MYLNPNNLAYLKKQVKCTFLKVHQQWHSPYLACFAPQVLQGFMNSMYHELFKE